MASVTLFCPILAGLLCCALCVAVAAQLMPGPSLPSGFSPVPSPSGANRLPFFSPPMGREDPLPPGEGQRPAAAALALPFRKEKPRQSASTPWFTDYMRVLERFPHYLARGWQGEDTTGYFGGPAHAEIAMRPLAHATLVLALLATDASYDPRPSGVAVETVRQRALACFRELVQTHVTGERRRPSGEAWGDDPQAPWWIGRLALAGQLLERLLSSADREGLRRVLSYEAGRLLARAPADGGTLETRAAENAWCAEALAWAACLYPSDPQAAAWEEKAKQFWMNSFSVAQDRLDETMVDGRPVREWVTTTNLLPDHLAASRGAVQFCYLALPLQSFASAYYAYSVTKRPPPEALFHPLIGVRRSLKRFYLFDGRFVYPAGQEWPRYTYGSYFALPGLVMLQQAGPEPSAARRMERGVMDRLEREQQRSGDGTFYGARLGGAVSGRNAIFETDTYAMVALAYLLHRQQPRIRAPAPESVLQEALAGTFSDPVAELVAARTPEAFASFAWRTVGRRAAPIGLFVPAGAADLVEWAPDQMVGSFEIDGFERARASTHRQRTIPGGFVATGRIDEGLRDGRPGIRHFVACAALPGERLALLFDLSLAVQGVRVTRNEGLQLALANDLFNENERTIATELGEMIVRGVEPGAPVRNRRLDSSWVNVDGRLGVVLAYGQEPFTLRDFSARGQRPTDPFRSLLVEVLCTPLRLQPAEYQARQVIRDTVILLVAGDAAATRAAADRVAVIPTGEETARAAWITGATGQNYLVAVNWGEREAILSLKPPRETSAVSARVPPLDALVLPRGAAGPRASERGSRCAIPLTNEPLTARDRQRRPA